MAMNKKVIFLMPRACMEPAGGFKVVFEYANRLVKDGVKVEIVYPMVQKDAQYDLLHAVAYRLIFIYRWLTGAYKPRWFSLHSQIKQRWVWCLDNCNIDCNAVVIATAIETAFSLQRNKHSEDIKRQVYFIQDYENWRYTDEEVNASYRLPMEKIVISNWLKNIVNREGEEAFLIPNGFDFNNFKLEREIETRNKHSVICMYHQDERKDLPTAFKAFEIVKRKHPELHVTMFGTFPKPDLPNWYSYIQRPDREQFNQLYNNAAIYVGSSKVEGWGLTVGEAMQCGCAVACTDNKGYLEMACNEKTALVSPIGAPIELAKNIIRLIEDDTLRHNIAKHGNEFIHGLNIKESYRKFKNCLLKT